MAYKSPGQVSQGKFSRRSLLKTTAAGVAASPLTGLSLASGRNDEGASHTRPETSSVVLRQEAKMAHSDELAYADVTEIARGIRQRQFSPVEVMNAFIARIEVRNPSLNALVYQGFDQARESAKDAAGRGMHQSDMVESVVAYCREPSRVCPLPPKWNPALGELLPNRVWQKAIYLVR